jgi:hypothetical protein
LSDESAILFAHKVRQVLNSPESLNSLSATIESEIKSAINPLDERIRTLETDNAVLKRVSVFALIPVATAIIVWLITNAI